MITPIFLNPIYSPSDTVLVVGSGRSGTTWLGNMIGQWPGFLSLFEPFDYRHVPEINITSLRPYIRMNETSNPLDDIIRNVLLGKYKNAWTLSENTRRFTWRILIKDIRINLLLPYIRQRFGNRIIYIIRHPCATVLSRLKLKWNTHLDDFLRQEQLMQDFLQDFEDLIQNPRNDLESHTMMWCVENLIPLKQLRKDQFHFCTYENLVQNTRNEVSSIFTGLGFGIRSKLGGRGNNQGSVSENNEVKTNSNERLKAWKNKLSKQDILSILRITNRFGIDIYDDSLMPNVNCSFLR